MTGRRGSVRGARIAALGVYAPERVLTNDELSQTLDTSDEWIRTRTGIRERRIARADQAPSDLAAEAGRRALNQAGFDPGRLDLIVSSSLIPDMVFPATAAVVAHRLGAVNAGAFDVQAGCTGFVYALACAVGFVGAGMYENILVVGAEVVSRGLDWQDRATCVLFGDGAGAALVNKADGSAAFTFDLGNDGSGAEQLNMPAGGARLPASHETIDNRQHFLKMNGPEVFRFATRKVAASCQAVLGEAGVGVADVDLFVPHQANMRIIDAAAKRLGFEPQQVFTNLDRFGNTSCASIPLCLAEAMEVGRLKKGDRLLMAGFGAGLSWGSCLMTWEL